MGRKLAVVAGTPTVTREGAGIVVRDPGALLTPAGTCVTVDQHIVNCPDGTAAAATVVITLNLGDGADTAVVNVPNAVIHGGPGRDTLTGSDGGNDTIYGEGDEDTVYGRGGDDALIDGIAYAAPNHMFGQAGDDALYGGTGADQLDGGDGFDTVSYADRGVDVASGVTVSLSGGSASGAGAPGENDSLAGIENLQGTAKNDNLSGDDGANIITAYGGDDRITGGPGVDLLYGGDGNDAINALDQGFDRVSCGGPQGGDTASVDDVDQLAGCPAAGAGLTVTAVPVPAPPDVTAPKVGVTYTKAVKVRTFRRRGATFTVFSSDKTVQNTVTAEMLGRVRSVKSFSKAAVGDLMLASRSTRLVGKKRITLKPSRRYRAHLRKGQRIRLRLTLTDQARNRATKTVIIRLK
jgi:Ca2+-binding RTX toxin-like protein